MVHPWRAYPDFCNIKQTGVLLPLPDGLLAQGRLPSLIKICQVCQQLSYIQSNLNYSNLWGLVWIAPHNTQQLWKVEQIQFQQKFHYICFKDCKCNWLMTREVSLDHKKIQIIKVQIIEVWLYSVLVKASVRVKSCPRTQHNDPARSWTQTSPHRVKPGNH